MYPTNTFSYYPQQQQPQLVNQQASILRGRPVSSFEEARAMTIDFDGSTFFFPDLANKRIYTKQINMDGTASLNMYELKGYITREEFEAVITELKNSMAAASPKASTEPTTSKPSAPAPDLSKLF